MMQQRVHSSALTLVLALASSSFAIAQTPVERIEQGNRITEGMPPLPAELTQRLSRYQNTRGASFAGWLADGGLLINTRFGETNQVHRVARPGAAREQLSFFSEPVMQATAAPARGRPGFAFGQDSGGSEFWQILHFDLESRAIRQLSAGGDTRNERPLWNHEGNVIAYSTTQRNGRDIDIHLVGLDGEASRAVVEDSGAWFPVAFSPDDRRLLVIRYVSINDSRPEILHLRSGERTPLYDAMAPAAYGQLDFSPDGSGVYYTSDEGSEFRQLRHRDLASGEVRSLTADLPWDVQRFVISDDGRHLAFVSNEDGIGKLHLLALPDEAPAALPELPVGVVAPGGFSADGQHLAVTINSATAPSDVYSVDLVGRSLTRWTRSEVGGLDTGDFIAPSLVRYPTFDSVDGEPRTIPAFYYRPAGEGPHPVVVAIHGGPEAQALPVFSPQYQFMLRELGIAVLVPNVRGSAGYGKTYLQLDNAEKREDSVRDIGALLDWIAEQPELDADRVGVVGGSYGGYMVLASLIHYNDRLRAGIDVVGISSFVTFLENTQDYRRDLRRAEYGDERDPQMREHLEKISPLNNAERIDRPLFVAQGANDPRVPASEAEQIVRAVRGNGGDVWYLLFEDEGHGFAKKTNADYYGAASMLFWQTHLLGE